MRPIKFYQVLLSVSFLLLIHSFSVNGQVYVPQNIFSNPVLQRAMENRNMTTTAISGLLRSQMMRGTAKGGKGGKTTVPASTGTTSFTASSANSIVKSLVTQMGGTAAEQKQVEDFFNSCIETYWDTARKDGFPINDLAYGFEYYVVNNIHVYHNVYAGALDYDKPADYTKHPNFVTMSREKVIYQQFRSILGSSPDIKKLTNKEKQQFTEMLVIMTNSAFKVYEAGLKNRDNQMIEQSQKMAMSNLETLFEIPADKVVIDNEGISLSN